MTFSRREVLKLTSIAGGTLLGASLLGGCGGSSGGGGSKQVVFADYGGTTREARRAAYLDGFEQDTGIKVISATADAAKFVLMARNGRSEWDTIDADNFNIVQWYNAKLLQPLPARVPQSPVVESPYNEYTTAGYTQSFNIGFSRTALGGKTPESWADFWDTTKFPGKRAFPAIALGVFEAALLADGVGPDDLYPIDFDRAVAKLDELRPDMLIYNSFGQGQQMLQSRSVVMAHLLAARIFALEDPDIDIVWNQSLLEAWTGSPVPNGAPNAENMFTLLEYMYDPARQAKFAELTTLSPTNPDAYALMDEALLKRLPGSPEHAAVSAKINPRVLADQYDEYSRRFSEWLAKS